MPKSAEEKLPWGLTRAEPGSIRLTRDKLEAFEHGINACKKVLSKKEQEELKKKQDEEATAEVLQDFVASFEDQGGKSFMKKFVKGAIINPGSKEEKLNDAGSYYKPSAKFFQKFGKKDQESPNEKNKNTKKSIQEKRKSNLEIFKEELKKIQEERQTRHRNKSKEDDKSIKHDNESNHSHHHHHHYNKHANDESVLSKSTTNIFLSNLSPSTREKELMEIFGQYGPLGSVKIMWPRTEEEKIRGNNCGFVAYMKREDAEKAIDDLDGTILNGLSMRLSWSKSVNLPSNPIYIPPELLEATVVPPTSGLPFNAQVSKSYEYHSVNRSHRNDEILKALENTTVKVTIPTDRKLLCLIHRMVEFVVREGSQFEAIIMSKEANNPQFRFLFDYQSQEHVYYRWRLFSILQGDSIVDWYTSKFQMFKNGSYWQPPQINRFTRCGRNDSYEKAKSELVDKKGQLSDEKRDKLENILRNLTPERKSIADAMIYCIENSESSREIAECIKESLSLSQTPLHKKIARLFLVSDILHNCGSSVRNSYLYRIEFQKHLPELFKHLNSTSLDMNDKDMRELFKTKILNCIRAWIDLAIYPMEFLATLQNNFIGTQSNNDPSSNLSAESKKEDDDLDGKPLFEGIQDYKSDGEEDIDGKPLNENEDDIDGKPMDENEDDIDGKPLSDNENDKKSQEKSVNKFVASKWETVNPDELEKQAVTTSKWDTFDEYNSNDSEPKTKEQEESNKQQHQEFVNETKQLFNQLQQEREQLSSEKRQFLRDIEIKAVKYQDELETGKAERNKDISIKEQVESYRHYLFRQGLEYSSSKDRQKSRSRSPYSRRSTSSSSYKKKQKSRSRSNSPNSKRYSKKSRY